MNPEFKPVMGMIVITGAAGLIGSAVVRELNRRGHENLILVDHLGDTDKWMNLRTLRFAEYMEKEDFFFLIEENNDFFSEASAFIHLGACSSTTERDASYLIQNNYQYSIALAEYASEHSIRMVYASSAATYGDGERGFDDDINTIQGLLPLNPYGYSKHAFDLWLKRLHFAPAFAGIKYFNIFGPNEYHKGEMRSVVLKAFYQIRDEGRLRLFKSYRDDYRDGEQKRDFLYVEDAAKMTVHLALDNREANGLFNAGRGEANTWLELAHAIFEAMGKKPQIEFIEMPESMRGKYQYYTCAPMQRMRETGYTTPASSLKESVSDYVQGYLLRSERRA
jgi:ADP-L-glycero-D-manno-heptose 6-epimerase